MSDLHEKLKGKVLSNLLERVSQLEKEVGTKSVNDQHMSIGQAIDLLNEGEAERVTCYDYDHTYMYVDEDKGELRTKALNGQDYPWVIKDRELTAIFRVVE